VLAKTGTKDAARLLDDSYSHHALPKIYPVLFTDKH